MASYSYDASQGVLTPVAGTPVSKLNEATSKAEASLDNQSDNIEAGTVATHAHAVGDFINYGTDKQFAEVTSPIAIGDSIANGGNVADKSIGGVLTNLNNALGGKTLWTNSSPTSSFAAQTVPISLSEYKYVMIKFLWSATGTSVGYKWVRVDVGDNAQEVWYSFTTPTYRHIYVTTTGVQFGDGYAGGTVVNTNYIPCEIVGYKA